MENWNEKIAQMDWEKDDKTGFLHWLPYHNKYTTNQVAVALCNLETDYRFLEDEEDRKLYAVWEIVHQIYGDAITNGYAFLFYQILYNITARYFENKIH